MSNGDVVYGVMLLYNDDWTTVECAIVRVEIRSAGLDTGTIESTQGRQWSKDKLYNSTQEAQYALRNTLDKIQAERDKVDRRIQAVITASCNYDTTGLIFYRVD